MKTHKLCNNCNCHMVCKDIDELLKESRHGDSCKWVIKLLNNHWWKFWIWESYTYIE